MKGHEAATSRLDRWQAQRLLLLSLQSEGWNFKVSKDGIIRKTRINQPTLGFLLLLLLRRWYRVTRTVVSESVT